MEHRYAGRSPVDVGLLIYRSGMPVATGRVRNASRIGMYVETDYRELHVYQRLECEFRLEGEMPSDRHRVRASIAREGAGGVGLELDEDDGDAAAHMDRLLRWSERFSGCTRST